jgi:subtilisin family serine protease
VSVSGKWYCSHEAVDLKSRRIIHTVFVVFLVLGPSLFLTPFSSQATCFHDVGDFSPEYEPPADSAYPIIHRDDRIDMDLDGIQDSLEGLISRISADEEAAVPVVVTLFAPVTEEDLNHFIQLGGQISCVYRYVTYGFAGTIPAANVSPFVDAVKQKLLIVEYDSPLCYHLDVSAPLIRARPLVWETYGHRGSPNQSIAILDTGIDDSHPDLGPFQNLNFSRKIVGWYDASSDGALTPEDYGEHGTHVAGIAAGTGAANNLQGSGDIETTFTYRLPPKEPGPWVYGYVDYIDVANPGTIRLNCSWGGSNNVLLVLSDPAGNEVKRTSGTYQPLILTYDTTGKTYPTGRYRVFVGNAAGPSSTPFSCVETYPYQGQNDGYALFSGVAPDSRLVGVKVFDNTGSGTSSTLIDAMDWIVQNRETYQIVVASMSVGLEGGITDSTLDQKADTLVSNGIVTTVSAGNSYPDYTIGSPGTAAYVITVAATNDQDGITSYSSNGDPLKNEYGLIKPDVAAPGGTPNPAYGNSIMSVDSNDADAPYSGFPDQDPDDYQQMYGTSMSAPHVAGVAALVIEAFGNWNWTAEEALKVKMLISMTAFETKSGEGTNQPSLDRGEKDDVEGYGRICADAAIEAATMAYTVGESANDTFGSDPIDKKVWARQVSLEDGIPYQFNLSVPSDADYDLYLYNGTPDTYGQPVILSKSVNASLGADEIIRFTSNTSAPHYILAKWVDGNGVFNLTSSTGRDVAIVSMEPSSNEVYEGDIVNVTVVVKNLGGFTETFTVTAKYENTTHEILDLIGTQNVTELAPSSNITLTLHWNTTGVQPCINYTIKAEASVVPSETDVVNNVYTDGAIKVKMEGDLNGDGFVDIVDLSIVGVAYGKFEGEPGYDPEADLNNDGFVDIGDITIVCIHYGETCL